MRKHRKIVALALAVMMLTGMTAVYAASDGGGAITVSLRIEGVDEPLYYSKAIGLEEGATVAELMAAVNETEDSPDIAITDSTYGSYVSEVGGLAEFSHGDMSGWSYRVNGLSPTFGMDEYILEDGDEVVYFFGDPFGIGMQYPVPDLTKLLSDGIIRFTSTDTDYDEDWNEIVSENPVEGAKVTFDGATYITDENGEIKIDGRTGLSGFHPLGIDKFGEDPMVPLVLRFAPDFKVYVPYADTPEGAWYDDAIMFCVREGFFIGTDLEQNLFAPLGKMKMNHLIIVLARIVGVDDAFDVAFGWAVENEIIAEDDFVVGENVTREQFIYMFCLAAALVGDYDMSLRADITGAADYENISENFRDAVSWAVAAGIIKGTDANALTIEPDFEINRATVCQMLLNYFFD